MLGVDEQVIQRFRFWLRLHHGKFEAGTDWTQTELDI
jgi:hypothetical protein